MTDDTTTRIRQLIAGRSNAILVVQATPYLVIGRYDAEQNSWVEGRDIRHVVSGHNSQSTAARAADHAHGDLGGCEGSNSLAAVAVRLSETEARNARAEAQDDPQIDLYEHADRVYRVLDVWDTHEVCAAPGGLGLRVR